MSDSQPGHTAELGSLPDQQIVALLQIAFPSLSHLHLHTPSKNSGEMLQRQSSMTPKLRNEVFCVFFLKPLTLGKLFLSLLGLFQSL